MLYGFKGSWILLGFNTPKLVIKVKCKISRSISIIRRRYSAYFPNAMNNIIKSMQFTILVKMFGPARRTINEDDLYKTFLRDCDEGS